MNLYRIKPIEWVAVVPSRGGLLWNESTASGYSVYKVKVPKGIDCDWYVARDPSGERIREEEFISEKEAQSACESHRRRILEAELEPVYQSTERPTKPGWYWFRESEDCSWVCVNVYEAKEEPDLIVENGMDDPNHLGNCPGEYVGPIPEPETKGDTK